MDNVIVTLQNQIPVQAAVERLTGIVEQLPVNMQSLKIGESILLKVLNGAEEGNTLSITAEIISENGKGAEVPIKIAAFPKPLLEQTPIKELEVKVTGRTAAQTAIKIISVNKEPADIFFKPAAEQISSGKNALASENAAVIKTTRPADFPELLPLKIKTLPGGNVPQVFTKAEVQISAAVKEINLDIGQYQKLEQQLKPVVTEIAANVVAKEPGETLVKILNPLQNQTIPGIVKSENNLRLIETPLGKIFMEDQGVKLPEGVKVAIRLQEVSVMAPKLKLSEILPDFAKAENLIRTDSPLLLEKAPLLQKILAPLQGHPQAAEVMQKIPMPNENLLPNLVNFMKAAVQKDVTVWLGQKLTKELGEMGEKGHETVARLTELIMPQTEKNLQSWRVVEIPFFSGEGVSKIRVALRRHDDEKDTEQSENRKKNGTRFVVDTKFSKLGAFQFDGFALADKRRFDLIVRTSKPITDDLYSNILRLYKTTLHEVDYHGNISINVKENFIKICDDDSGVQSLAKGVYI